MYMKYIVIEILGQERVFIFQKEIQHGDLWQTLRENYNPQEVGLVSAGQILYKKERGFICTGESLTLEIKSRKEIDTELLMKQFEI